MIEVLDANEAVQRALEFLTCFCGGELEADGDGLKCSKCGLRLLQ